VNRRHFHRDQTGMTLIEIMVTVGILSVVLVALTTILFSSTHQSGHTAKRADAQAASRQAISLMTTELRQAGADPSIPPVGIVGIVSGDSASVRVRSDLNGNGTIQTTEPSEDVTYSYSSGSQVLSRNPGAGAVALISNVTDMRLSYFASDGTAITALPLSATDAALVTSIGVTLTVEEGDTPPITLTTRVNLRNR
jgi:type IV pilus assembly protein PilW